MLLYESQIYIVQNRGDVRMEHNIIVPRLSTLFIQDGSNEINIIEKLVTNHDIQYKSINFGEDVIKEMIMSSVFGIPVSAKVLYYDIIIWSK